MADTLLQRMGFQDPDLRSEEHDRIVMSLVDPLRFARAARDMLDEIFAEKVRDLLAHVETCPSRTPKPGSDCSCRTFSDHDVERIQTAETSAEDFRVVSARTEFPLKNRKGFLVGFADLLVEIQGHSLLKGWGTHLQVLVEVKSRITGFGEVMRQLNLYRECAPRALLLLVVPEGAMPDGMALAFRNQGVHVGTAR